MGDRVKFQSASAETLPHPDESFDMVVSSLAFQYLSQNALREAVRVLKRGGQLLIAVHTFELGGQAKVFESVRKLMSPIFYVIPRLRAERLSRFRAKSWWRSRLYANGIQGLQVVDLSPRRGGLGWPGQIAVFTGFKEPTQ